MTGHGDRRARERLFAEIKAKGDRQADLDYFDSLPAVTVPEIGAWAGSGFETGHPLDGMLENFRRHGSSRRCSSC